MELKIGKEHLIVQGMTHEENPWGKYQFPTPYRLKDRIIVSVHVEADTLVVTGNPKRWFESTDEGETWREIPHTVAAECGLQLPSGDKIFFPVDGGIDLSDYEFANVQHMTPDYDLQNPAEPGKLPFQDGVTAWRNGEAIYAYNADRLPPPLCEKKWRIERIPAGKTEKITEYAALDWPYLTRVAIKSGGKVKMKPIHPVRAPKLGPDGAIWISTFSGEGHLNPKNGQYSPYYSAEILRSADNGRTFSLHAHMEYPADGEEYPYLSGGFSDNDFEFMDDGSIIWFFRSAWFGATAWEWAPMYVARSFDYGKTWTKPQIFSPMGVYPSLCKLPCGATLICYARPGMFVRACKSNTPDKWDDPIAIFEVKDRSHLANIKIEKPTFHQWDGQCGNPTLLPLNDREALLFYGDFYYPDAEGVKRKSILCRKITVLSL